MEQKHGTRSIHFYELLTEYILNAHPCLLLTHEQNKGEPETIPSSHNSMFSTEKGNLHANVPRSCLEYSCHACSST